MKKLLIITLLLTLSGCGLPTPPFGTVNNISSAKLAEKFNASQEIKTKYKLEGSSLKTTPKEDPKDKIEVTIGDTPVAGMLGAATDFTPKVTISRWDEVSLALTPKALDTVATKDKTLDLSSGTIKVGTPKVDYQIYDLPISDNNPEGGLEYEVDLKEKPATNVVQFKIDTQGLDFFYQPALDKENTDKNLTCTETQCKDAKGNVMTERPENVVGSYAVYASENKINYVGGKLYKTGQVGMIYRPKIMDSAGNEVWGELNIDTKAGILSVTIPQNFLDKAVYPVRHAAGLTFGYTTAGSSNKVSPRTNGTQGSLFTTSGQSGTVTDINISCAKGASATTIKGAIYAHAAKPTLITNALSGANSVTNTSRHWETLTFSTNPTISDSTDYVLASGVSTGSDTAKWYYDSGSADQGHSGTTVVGTATWTDGPVNVVHSTDKYSIYATYTAGGGGTTAAPDDGLIIFE